MAGDEMIRLRHNPDATRRRQSTEILKLTHNPNARRRNESVLQLKRDPAAPWNHGENKKKGIKVKVPDSCPICHSNGNDAKFSTIKENGILKWKCSICESMF